MFINLKKEKEPNTTPETLKTKGLKVMRITKFIYRPVWPDFLLKKSPIRLELNFFFIFRA
jgi:hypothetical protein